MCNVFALVLLIDTLPLYNTATFVTNDKVIEIRSSIFILLSHKTTKTSTCKKRNL